MQIENPTFWLLLLFQVCFSIAKNGGYMEKYFTMLGDFVFQRDKKDHNVRILLEEQALNVFQILVCSLWLFPLNYYSFMARWLISLL
jgi:hypothetical protein